MTKHEFKKELEELPHLISLNYMIKKPNKESYGELVFYGHKKDVLLKIKSINYEGNENE